MRIHVIKMDYADNESKTRVCKLDRADIYILYLHEVGGGGHDGHHHAASGEPGNDAAVLAD